MTRLLCFDCLISSFYNQGYFIYVGWLWHEHCTGYFLLNKTQNSRGVIMKSKLHYIAVVLLIDHIDWGTKTQIWNISKVKNRIKRLYKLSKIPKFQNLNKKRQICSKKELYFGFYYWKSYGNGCATLLAK